MLSSLFCQQQLKRLCFQYQQLRGKKWFPSTDNSKHIKRHMQYTRRVHRKNIRKRLVDIEAGVMTDLSQVWRRMQAIQEDDGDVGSEPNFNLTRKQRNWQNIFDSKSYYGEELDLTKAHVAQTVYEIEEELKQQEQEKTDNTRKKQQWRKWQEKKLRQYSEGMERKYQQSFDEFVTEEMAAEAEEERQQQDAYDDAHYYQQWQQWNQWKQKGGQKFQYNDSGFKFNQQEGQQQQGQGQGGMEKSMVRYLQVLGIPSSINKIDPTALKEAFHKHAKVWHPDRHHGKQKEEAEKKFKEVQEAYMILKKFMQSSATFS
eukprot:TRINITY_DN2294_c0_g2_i8.p1 TRINITY_DN2294_c0_g2~~TRINITY_DN2294_c0_g2_i8.p1  ORF type:complete len:315 (-),score=45.04 TRINITY_DN2294_c0_g2_i8:237-1181(-)